MSKNIYIRTFGCRQNFADSERILGVLKDYTKTDDINTADLIVFNTCAVRESAEEKAFGLIGELSHIKKKRPNVIIAVGGCMAQIPENAERIRRSYKQVDVVFGTKAIAALPELIKEAEKSRRFVSDTGEYKDDFAELKPLKVGFLADIPIMYGCDNFCSYCIVPYVRGRERSREASEILSDIKAAVSKGAKEIMLLGQNVNSYGKGLSENVNFVDFAGLLRRVNDVPGDFRVRFMSPHPYFMTDDVISAIADCEKICKSIHLPLQSGSNRILTEMNRRYSRERYLEIVDTAREKIPGLSISTDIIVGFPNETDADFEDTLDIVKRVRFSNIFTFIYSKRRGTKAALIDDQTPYEEKQARMGRLLSLQREISTALYSEYIGKTLKVLIETKKDGLLSGKSEEFIIVNTKSEEELIGEIKNIEITKSHNWALEGIIKNLGE
jgi:tRNA-2-methylthio-N6-dimethylallyladenosine synthase